MASGFNISPEQITPSYYNVTLTMNTTNYPVYSGSGTPTAAQGGVNPYDWNANTVYTGGVPSNAGYATALAQGNVRFERIMQLITSYADCRCIDPLVTVAGTSANFQPTALSFTLVFDRDEFILPEYSKVQAAAGAASSGTYSPSYQTQSYGVALTSYLGQDGSTIINTTARALQDIVTTAICSGSTSGWSKSYRVYSASQNGDGQATISIQQPATPATVFGTVSVSPVGTTGINF